MRTVPDLKSPAAVHPNCTQKNLYLLRFMASGGIESDQISLVVKLWSVEAVENPDHCSLGWPRHLSFEWLVGLVIRLRTMG